MFGQFNRYDEVLYKDEEYGLVKVRVLNTIVSKDDPAKEFALLDFPRPDTCMPGDTVIRAAETSELQRIVLCSTLAVSVGAVYGEFEDRWGFGPCGAYAVLKARQGMGRLAVCMCNSKTNPRANPFPHYILISKEGQIIDLANPLVLAEEIVYSDIEILQEGEMPDLVDEDVIEWLRVRL